MGKNKLCLLLFLSAFQFNAFGFDKIGSYLFEYSIFKIDVYQISYFKAKDAEKLVLDYKTAVKKEHSLEGWKVGLKHRLKDKSYQAKAQWLFDHTFDVNKGDSLSMIKKDQLLEIYMNEKLVGKTSDPMISEIAFEPWLGDKPIDEDLKKSLLGK
jgi:hypothetical protein